MASSVQQWALLSGLLPYWPSKLKTLLLTELAIWPNCVVHWSKLCLTHEEPYKGMGSHAIDRGLRENVSSHLSCPYSHITSAISVSASLCNIVTQCISHRWTLSAVLNSFPSDISTALHLLMHRAPRIPSLVKFAIFAINALNFYFYHSSGQFFLTLSNLFSYLNTNNIKVKQTTDFKTVHASTVRLPIFGHWC